VKPPVSTAIPRLNFNTEEWGELIDISVMQYEPACMRNISDEDLEAMVRVGLQFQFGETAGTYCGKKCIQKAEEKFQKQARLQMKVFFVLSEVFTFQNVFVLFHFLLQHFKYCLL
jgi:hypothetical protein